MAAKKTAKKTAQKPTHAPVLVDPTADASLLALSVQYSASPDIPVAVAGAEIASLARLARSQQAQFTAIGLGPEILDTLARHARRLVELEEAWSAARSNVKLTAAQQKLRAEAEALDSKLVAGGRWAFRKDAAAQETLTRIAEGSGLADTIQDLRDLVVFWTTRKDQLGKTDITEKDLARAAVLANDLDAAAAKEASNVDAARALDLRNRSFWASDELAREVREGGRYAFRSEPKIAVRFVSRYRASAAKRYRVKSKAQTPAQAPVG